MKEKFKNNGGKVFLKISHGLQTILSTTGKWETIVIYIKPEILLFETLIYIWWIFIALLYFKIISFQVTFICKMPPKTLEFLFFQLFCA